MGNRDFFTNRVNSLNFLPNFSNGLCFSLHLQTLYVLSAQVSGQVHSVICNVHSVTTTIDYNCVSGGHIAIIEVFQVITCGLAELPEQTRALQLRTQSQHETDIGAVVKPGVHHVLEFGFKLR